MICISLKKQLTYESDHHYTYIVGMDWNGTTHLDQTSLLRFQVRRDKYIDKR